MRPPAKAPWFLIVAVAVVAYAVISVAQWKYPVKSSPTPELNDRWRRWAEEIRRHEKEAAASERAGNATTPATPTTTGGTANP